MGDVAGEIQIPPPDWNREPRMDLISLVPADAGIVLDVGCWYGYTSEELNKRGLAVWACDLADKREVGKDIPFRAFDLEFGTPYIDGFFDCVIVGDVIEHLIDTHDVLLRLKDALRVGGRIVLSVPNIGYLPAAYEIINQDFPRHDCGHFDRTHLRFFTRNQIAAAVEEAGFVDIEIYAKRLDRDPVWPQDKLGDDGLMNYSAGNLCIGNVTKDLFTQLTAYQWLVRARKP